MVSYWADLLTVQAIAMIALMLLVTLIVSIQIVQRMSVRGLGAAALLSFVLPAGVVLAKATFVRYLETDELTWHQLGKETALYIVGDRVSNVDYVEGKEGYLWILGTLYAFGGAAPLIGVVFNLCLTVVTCLIIAATTKILGMELKLESTSAGRSAVLAAIAYAAAPGTLLWTPALLRESISILCVVACVLGLVQVLTMGGTHWIVVVVTSIALMWWIRSSMGMMLLAATVLAFGWVWAGRLYFRLYVRSSLVIAVGIIAIVNGNAISLALVESAEGFSQSTAELSEIATSGFPGLSWNSSLLSILAVTSPRVLVGPLPWDMSLSPSMLIAAAEGLFWLGNVILAFSTAVRIRKKGSASTYITIVVIVVGILLAAFMVSVGNYGLLSRFRPMAAAVLIPLAATYFYSKAESGDLSPRKADHAMRQGNDNRSSGDVRRRHVTS